MPRPSLHLPIAALILLGCLAGSVFAQAQPTVVSTAGKPTSAASIGGPGWATLTPQQRQALAPLERDWNGIDANRKSKWLEIASRFPKMPLDEQKRVQERMTEWARLSPAERGRARLSFQEVKQLSPQQRQERWAAYQALPDTERRALAAKASSRPLPASTPASSSLALSPKVTASQPRTNNATVQPIAPTVVQARPGATTTLIGKGATPPAHQRAGQPKIAAKPSQVDRSTLLPKAATAATTPSSPAAGQASEPQL